MGLAFDAIFPNVYPVAMKLFKEGMEKHFIAGEVFYEFAKKYDIPKNKLNTAMIDLSITCAEKDFQNNVEQNCDNAF